MRCECDWLADDDKDVEPEGVAELPCVIRKGIGDGDADRSDLLSPKHDDLVKGALAAEKAGGRRTLRGKVWRWRSGPS